MHERRIAFFSSFGNQGEHPDFQSAESADENLSAEVPELRYFMK